MASRILEAIKRQIAGGETFRIVFLGDSITSTEWVHPNWREIVEYVLKEELTKVTEDWKVPAWRIRCVNSGFDGATTQDWLDRLEPEVLAFKPSMVLVVGTRNDLSLGIAPEVYGENLDRLLGALVVSVPHVVFASDPAGNRADYNMRYAPYLAVAKELGRRHPKVIFIDLFERYRSYDLNRFYTFTSSGNDVLGLRPGDVDYVHPNQLGNAYIAKVLLEDIFGLSFNPDRYLRESAAGVMYPGY